jgi:hypothetical protein
MALITSAQSGNFNATATWTGGVVPGVGDEARASTGHTITITANATCDEISNAGTGRFVINSGVTLTANVTPKTTTAGILLEFNTASPAEAFVVGNVSAAATNAAIYGIANTSTGTLRITGNALGTSTTANSAAILNSGSGIINITGNSTGSAGTAIRNSNTGTIIATGNVEAGTGSSGFGHGIFNNLTGIIQVVGNVTASTNLPAISSTNTSSVVRVSGSFIHASNGQVPVASNRILLWSTPSNSMTRYAVDGIGNYVDYFTADTNLGQANPSDVRTGVSYASGNLTGTLTVPVRGTISYGVTYGPAMPFTATRSGTTATATLAYSYPYQVGDTFTVSGAFYSDWNGDYTVASVVSGTSITFSVPDTLPASTGAGAVLQTKGTAVLDGASVASAVWSAATRTITGGLVDTATTLTNAPTVPSVVQIRQEMDSNSTKLANLDATISSRSILTTGDLPSVPSAASVASAVRTELTEISNLDASVSSRLASSAYTAPTSAPSASAVATAVRTELGTELGRIDQSISSRLASADYTTPPTTAQIATAVEGSLLNENDGQAVLNALVGAIGNQNVDEIALVAAIRSDLERTGGKLDSIPTDAAPSAASVATAVWSASTKEITGGTVTTLTNSPDVPTEAEIASAVWSAASREITGGVVDTLTNAPASVTPSDIWSHSSRTLTSASGPTAVEIRQEIDANSTKLDAAVSTRLAGSAYTAPANSDVAAIKAKTDALNTERLANVATTAIVGNLLAQANS